LGVAGEQLHIPELWLWEMLNIIAGDGNAPAHYR